ncbi:MAG: dTDP-4-dehydrorhamnose reductase [Rhodoferax sp.]|nr:dTDP-4-dehydrorhamnose reductase [Rhodoferax sp.]
MKILLLGCDGQVGWELQRSLAPLGELWALGRRMANNPQGLCADFTQLDALAQTVRTIRPDVIVNAAAHTAVDKAESEPELAHMLNAHAPGVLASEAQRLGALLVHYSTDYVFDGNGERPWRENDATAPLNVYGQTKLAGELAVAQCARYLIFRTSWVYAARGGNFARTMLRLAREREVLQVIDDQIGAPTGAELLADVTAHAIRQASTTNVDLSGIYHLAANGFTSWFEYANHVITLARQAEQADTAIKIKAQTITPVPTTAFPTPARRPHNSRLDTRKLQTTFGLTLPDWQTGVNRMLKEINYGHSV